MFLADLSNFILFLIYLYLDQNTIKKSSIGRSETVSSEVDIPMPPLRVQDTLGLFSSAVLETQLRKENLKKISLWGSNDVGANFTKLKSLCEEFKSLLIPTRQDISSDLRRPSVKFTISDTFGLQQPDLLAKLSNESVTFQNGDFIYYLPTTAYGADEISELPPTDPILIKSNSSKENLSIFDLNETLPPPLLRGFSSSLRDSKLNALTLPSRNASADSVPFLNSDKNNTESPFNNCNSFCMYLNDFLALFSFFRVWILIR